MEPALEPAQRQCRRRVPDQHTATELLSGCPAHSVPEAPMDLSSVISAGVDWLGASSAPGATAQGVDATSFQGHCVILRFQAHRLVPVVYPGVRD